MKKKIKDLTREETVNICKGQAYCYGCPLEFTKKCAGYEYKDEDEEIEIPDIKKNEEEN